MTVPMITRLKSIVLVGAVGVFSEVEVVQGQTVRDVFSFSNTYSASSPFYVTPAQGVDGSLYGTDSGFVAIGTGSDGAVFKVTTDGFGKALHRFGGPDGETPYGSLVLGSNRNFVGTTTAGGAFGYGVLFQVTPTGLYKKLYDFTGQADGGGPEAPPIEAFDGNYYGVTAYSSGSGENAGTVYKYTPSGGFNTVFSFPSDGSLGTGFEFPLVQGSDGNLYGVSNLGGSAGCGTIFKMSRTGSLLYDYSFPCGAGGEYPVGSLIEASDGNFYGTTELGGTGNQCRIQGCGTFFRMTPQGSVSVLYNFLGSHTDGGLPIGGLVQGNDGQLYGITGSGGKSGDGTFYRMTTDGAETSLYSFTKNVAENAAVTPLQHTSGVFYGTSQLGGKFGQGALFSVDIGLGPFITFVIPAGLPGKTAQILGQGLTGTTDVSFNGVPASSFEVVSDTFMTAVVPADATTGTVTVTTPAAVLTSNKAFQILQ